MNRTITQEENEQLFQFCRRHYVYHYDVQIELVDHLASAIEEQWQQNPELSFDEVLKNSFKKFGIYGFSKIKKQKERELKRKYNRLLWKYLVKFYRWPKVITTFICTLGLFLLFQIVDQTFWIIATFAFLVLFGVIIYHRFFLKKIKLQIIPGKSFLLADQLEKVTSVYVLAIQLPNISVQLFNLSGTFAIKNSWILLAISFIMVALTVLLYGQLFYLPKKIKEHFLEQFAEFAL
ncbi:hypothetical protein [Draconibacterium halophilum]|uniref:Uncharacterized protein n=1 Tax=Draconibacterium halophilum TaxID=2706887 RepID=A0A6C0RAE0_9BACT|nr:hypothetical protein [Draconibacterium halophilum]QIA07057.1 hypothetical protein G0Q07_04605 [Draconibacterium halophilum]